MTISEFVENNRNTVLTTLCAVIVLACSFVIYENSKTPSYPQGLVEIDSICNDNPLKAEQMLARYKKLHANMNDDARWYCRFLALKADVKQNKPESDDKEPTAILHHFMDTGDKRMMKFVYYYVGCAYNLVGRVQPAISCFHDGLDLLSGDETDDQLRALYYYMLGFVYTYQYLDDEALEMKLKSLAIHKRLNNPQRMQYDYIALSWTYKAMEKYDKALECLKSARNLTGDKGARAEIDSQIADVYFNMGRLAEAKLYINKALGHTDNFSESSIHNIAATIYEASGDQEKARHYYSLNIANGTIYGRQCAYKFFAKYYKGKNNIEKAFQYGVLYANVTDTIVQINASEYSARANAEFDNKEVEDENNRLRANEGRRNMVITLSVLVMVVVVGYYFVFRYRQKRKYKKLQTLCEVIQNRSDKAAERYNRELQEVKEKLHGADIENSDLRMRYKLKVRQLESLLQKNALLNKISTTSDSLWKETEMYAFLNKLYDNREPITQDTINWEELGNLLFDIFPTFRTGLMQFKKMKDQPYHVCLLIKAGCSVQQIAYLTIKSVEAINSTRRRLYMTNFGSSGKPSEWDEIIRGL